MGEIGEPVITALPVSEGGSDKYETNTNSEIETEESFLESEQNESAAEVLGPSSPSNSNGSEEAKCSEREEYRRHLQECTAKMSNFEELHRLCQALESKLQVATKQSEMAVKEKEAMVVRYAMGEKTVLEERNAKNQFEKKHKDALRENEILQHKLSSMASEKTRICQMLDNKCYEHKNSQQECDRLKADLTSVETKLKWSQNSLKAELEIRREADVKAEGLGARVKELSEEIERTKREAQETMKSFYASQDNRAHVLDQQVKEQQATLILLRHERDDREKQVKTLQAELERLQSKQKETLNENNSLSMKVQQFERERLETQQRLSELRSCADQQRQDSADLASKNAQIEQLRLQIQNEQEQRTACDKQTLLIKQRNADLENDMRACRKREAELLLFTQQLTDKNVRLQSEFTTMNTKVQQLTCEQTISKRQLKEVETKSELLSTQLCGEREKYQGELADLMGRLDAKERESAKLLQEVQDQRGENTVIRRKLDMQLKEVSKELQQCRKKLDKYESTGTCSSSSSSSTTEDQSSPSNSPDQPQIKVVEAEITVDKQTLIQHVVKLQRVNARKSEKIDFLEEHVNTLVAELQRKTRLLQGYIIREQSGALTSNKMEKNKAKIANGIMASVYGSRVADSTLTLELSLDINHKLQAVLEDALLKNITLKENVDTLGAEIERLSCLLKSSDSL